MHYLAPYNASYVLRLPLVKRSSVDLAVKADYTPANGDCNISKDGGAQANPANNLNIVTGTTWNVTLSATEMSAKEIIVMVRNNSAVEDQWVTIRTYGNASAYYAWNMEAANLPADLRQIAGSAVSGPATAGILDVNVKNVNNVTATTNLAADLRQIVGAAVSGPQTAGVLDVNVKNVNNAVFNANQAQFGASVVSIVNNAITALAINANAITGAKVANDVDIRNVTGNVAGTVGSVTGNVGAVTGNIGGNVAGSVGSVTGNVAAVTGNVGGNIGGNVVGTVASVVGNVAAVTGNIGGNVAGSVGSVVGLTASDVGAIKAKTDNLPTDPADESLIIAATDAIMARIGVPVTNNISEDVSTRATPAQVNAEVVDALATDTYAEPGQGAPAATTTLAAKVNYLFKFARNKIEQTNNTLSIYNDAGNVVDQKSTVSDDGSTYTRGEIGSGP
jgi:hypothetical protein